MLGIPTGKIDLPHQTHTQEYVCKLPTEIEIISFTELRHFPSLAYDAVSWLDSRSNRRLVSREKPRR